MSSAKPLHMGDDAPTKGELNGEDEAQRELREVHVGVFAAGMGSRFDEEREDKQQDGGGADDEGVDLKWIAEPRWIAAFRWITGFWALE